MDYFEYIRQASREQLCALLCNMWTDPDRLRDSTFITEPYHRKVMDFLNSEAPEDSHTSTAREMFENMGYILIESRIHMGSYKGSHIPADYFFRFIRGRREIVVQDDCVTLTPYFGGDLTDEEDAAINALREEMKPHEHRENVR